MGTEQRIAVTGYNGRLGSCLLQDTSLNYVPLDCDITNPKSIKVALDEANPDIVINCAAYTDVDGAEVNYRHALNINQLGVGILRDEFEGWLIHISTDYVFGGVHGPYTEGFSIDDDFPKGRYGKSKAYGENNMFLFPDRDGTIIRTTMLYGSPYKKEDFVNSVLLQLREGKTFEVPYNLLGSPTYIPHLIDGIGYLIRYHWHNPPPIINIVGDDVISRYDFAIMIASIWGYDKQLIKPVVWSCKNGAPRPKKAGLRTGLAKRMHIPIYSVIEGLEDMKNAKKTT